MRIRAVTPVVLTILAGVVAGATSRARLTPSPSETSRANDTPVLDHVPGGGPSGGAVAGLALVADRPGTVFASFESGGVLRSHDYGLTWVPADRGLPADTGCELRAVHGEPATLYAACFDDLFKTTNSGALWRQLDVDHTRLPFVAPSDPRVVYQPPFHDVVRSRDAGRRWERLLPNVPSPCSGGLAIHPANPLTLFCTNEDVLSSSRDGGATWHAVGARLPVGPTTSLAIHPTDFDTLIVGTEGGHLLKTRDAGRTWTRIVGDARDGDALENAERGDWDTLEYVGSTGDVLIGRIGERIARSRDGGDRWEPLDTTWAHDSMQSFAVDPSDPWTVYVGTSSGVMVTRDFGQTWSRRSAGISRMTTTVALHEGPETTTLYAVSSEWSDTAELFTSADGGGTWRTGTPPAMPPDVVVRTLRSDGFGGLTVQAGGQYYRMSRGEVAWRSLNLPSEARLLSADEAHPGAPLVAAVPDGYFLSSANGDTWQRWRLPARWGPLSVTSALVRSRLMLVGTLALPGMVSLWRSVDGGQSWEAVDSMLDYHRQEKVRADPHADNVAFLTTNGLNVDGDMVYRSTDAGATWTEVKLGGLSTTFALVPTRPTTVLAQLGDFEGDSPLLVSTDAGTSWRPAGAGLPPGTRLTNIVSHPSDPRRLFAGTRGRGVYRSTDAGANWSPAGTTTSP